MSMFLQTRYASVVAAVFLAGPCVHAGAPIEGVEIPWIINGPGVVQGKEIKSPVNTYDTAPTVAYIFGVTAPVCWIGQPVREAFKMSEAGSAK